MEAAGQQVVCFLLRTEKEKIAWSLLDLGCNFKHASLPTAFFVPVLFCLFCCEGPIPWRQQLYALYADGGVVEQLYLEYRTGFAGIYLGGYTEGVEPV